MRILVRTGTRTYPETEVEDALALYGDYKDEVWERLTLDEQSPITQGRESL